MKYSIFLELGLKLPKKKSYPDNTDPNRTLPMPSERHTTPPPVLSNPEFANLPQFSPPPEEEGASITEQHNEKRPTTSLSTGKEAPPRSHKNKKTIAVIAIAIILFVISITIIVASITTRSLDAVTNIVDVYLKVIDFAMDIFTIFICIGF